jgi:uncharacterized membrane protein YcaP (DUF421 family)
MFERWLAEVFSSPDVLTLFVIVGRTALIYVWVVVGMRLLGARARGQMSASDFVLVVVVANAVQNALIAGSNTLVGGLVSALVLLLLNLAYTWALNRFPRWQNKLIGEPVVLIAEGGPRWQALEREGVTRDELMAALREHGVTRIENVRLAVLEIDGVISVIPRADHDDAHPPQRGGGGN